MKKIFFAALLFALPAMASDSLMWPQRDDTITVQLNAEDYVTATTAKVTLSVSAALKDADATATRKEILSSAQKIAKTPWRITSFNRSTDQAGLERWDAVLESRLPEAQLTGLTATAKSASRPGLQFTLAGTELTPTLDEMEAGRAKLRATLLAKANEELARVNKGAGGRNYRISDIQYGVSGMPMMNKAMPMMARGMAMDGAVASVPEQAEGLTADQKISMAATVMFATVVK